jgi:hypothetical protein
MPGTRRKHGSPRHAAKYFAPSATVGAFLLDLMRDRRNGVSGSGESLRDHEPRDIGFARGLNPERFIDRHPSKRGSRPVRRSRR